MHIQFGGAFCAHSNFELAESIPIDLANVTGKKVWVCSIIV
jgi:hypothetical protein